MEIDTKGCSVFVTVILVLLAIAAIVIFVAPALDRAAADRDQAAAARIRAETAYEAQRSENWQHEFMLWTAFMELNDDDLLLLVLAIIVGVGAFVIGLLAGKRGGAY